MSWFLHPAKIDSTERCFLQMGNLISPISFTVGFYFWRRPHFEFLVYCSRALSFCQYDYISSFDSLVLYQIFIIYSFYKVI